MDHELDLLLRLAMAAVLGGVVGIEREQRHSWTAGLRTHMLVSVGSCLFMLTSIWGFEELMDHERVSLDPSRVASQVASGIGFLGAGAILLRKEFIRGLTTAASIWTVAAIGLACGGDMFIEAAGATALALAILAGMKPIERRFFKQRANHKVLIRAAKRGDVLASLRSLADRHRLTLVDFKMHDQPTTARSDIAASAESLTKPLTKPLATSLAEPSTQGAPQQPAAATPSAGPRPAATTHLDLTLYGTLPEVLDLVQELEDGGNGSAGLQVEAVSGQVPE